MVKNRYMNHFQMEWIPLEMMEVILFVAMMMLHGSESKVIMVKIRGL
jgi:hypothetical protein